MTDRGQQQIARITSVLFHPAVVMVVAAGIAAGAADLVSGVVWQALGLTVAVAVVVMLYSARQARSGRWSHIDASRPNERSQLNRFASWLLLGLAVLLALVDVHRSIVLAIGLSGLIVLASHLLRGRLKSSLHVAFAAFATCMVWPHSLASTMFVLVTLVVAWSRVALHRHDLREVVVGGTIGLTCGVLFRLFGQ